MEAVQSLIKPLSLIGVGSVPFVQGENTCEWIFKHWDIPFWPQYPARSFRENFVFQFLDGFPGLRVSEKEASFEEQEFLSGESEYKRRLEASFANFEFLCFEPAGGWASGYDQMKTLLEQGAFPEKQVLKLQITGYETVWKSFFSKRVSRPPQARRIRKMLSLTLIAKGLAQIERALSADRVPLIFIDEPLYAGASNELGEMVERFRQAGARVGIHLCSNVCWDGLGTLGLDFFHFDLTAREKWSESNGRFIQTVLQSGSWIVWGVVPTHPVPDFQIRNYAPPFLDILNTLLQSVVSTQEALNRSLLAASCGTGTLSPAQSEAVFQSLRQTAESLKIFLKK